jgi:hypothetical protein
MRSVAPRRGSAHLRSRGRTGAPPRGRLATSRPRAARGRCALAALIGLAGCPADAGYEPWILDDLAPAEGFVVRTPELSVPRGTELQDCFFFRVPDLDGGRDLWIDRVALALNTGSHHMNVLRVRTIVGLDPDAGAPVDLGGGITGTVVRGADSDACWKSANWADWPLVSNSQQSAADQQVVDWRLPPDVAMRLVPGEQLMLQVHYVNTRDQETPFVGRGGASFFRSRDGDTQELGTLFATQQSIRVCRSAPRPSYSGACALPRGEHTVIAANGHFHGRGRRFRVYAWDGRSPTRPPDAALFYESRDWAEPKMAIDLAVPLPDPGGVFWTCDYQWMEPPGGCAAVDARDPQAAGDCCYTFGPTVETSEHCNVFVYYHPKVDQDVTCF